MVFDVIFTLMIFDDELKWTEMEKRTFVGHSRKGKSWFYNKLNKICFDTHTKAGIFGGNNRYCFF